MIGMFMNASCEGAASGWPCDEAREAARGFPEGERLAQQRDRRRSRQRKPSLTTSTHIPLGLYVQPIAVRKNINNVVAPAPCSGT